MHGVLTDALIKKPKKKEKEKEKEKKRVQNCNVFVLLES
jgi:hypothetical protein